MEVRVIHATGFVDANGKGGNDAGVVLPHDQDSLSDVQRLEVAAALGFPETVFVSSLRSHSGGNCDISLRYFTPVAEVELCGHATVACVGVLHDHGLLKGAMRGTLHTRAGAFAYRIRSSQYPGSSVDDTFLLPEVALTSVTTATSNIVYMQQLAPSIDPPLVEEDMAAVAVALCGGGDGAADAAVAHLEQAWTPRVASTGLRDLLVALRSTHSLDALRPDMGAVAELSRRLGTVGMHAFAPERASAGGGSGKGGGAAGHYRVRNFAPLFGIDEESATGTSNCALACALWHSGVVPRGTPLSFGQGEAMGMPSFITVLPPVADTRSATDGDAGGSAEADEAARPWVGGGFRYIKSVTLVVSTVVQPGSPPRAHQQPSNAPYPLSPPSSSATPVVERAGSSLTLPLPSMAGCSPLT